MSEIMVVLFFLAGVLTGAFSGVVAGAAMELLRARLDKARWQALRARTFRQNMRLILS